MQMSITPGDISLPALACTKYSHWDGDQFYALDTPQCWDPVSIAHHIYKDPIQFTMRTILARSFIIFFKTLEYEQDPLMQLYEAQFPKHHEQMIQERIAIVENECKCYITFMQRYGSPAEMLTKHIYRITTRKLVRLILNCTSAIRAKKNWNSHGATVRSAICNLLPIISSLSNASASELDPNFIELIPCGVVHTGHKYGNHDTVYTGFMASALES